MIIELKKFGTTLTSRQDGKEALAAINSELQNLQPDEVVEVDFSGVVTFTPSWADEFLSNLFKKFNERVVLKNTENPSVKATLKFLEEISQRG